MIYKIFRRDEWLAFFAAGVTAGAPVDLADGFIHFSGADQVRETARRHFAGTPGLVLAACDPAGPGDALRWEASRGGALFPHLYRPLRLEDVIWAQPLPLRGGTHVFPGGVG
jgi:uncharacterized protein (DUF952 family)